MLPTVAEKEQFWDIIEVIIKGSCADLQKCVKDVNPIVFRVTDDDGWSLLTHAVFFEQSAKVQCLLDHGAIVERCEDLLHISTDFDDIETTKVLVLAGASVNSVDIHDCNHTPLTRALVNRNADIGRLLLQNGANANQTGYQRQLPIQVVCKAHWSEGLSLLLGFGANPLSSTCDRFHVAAGNFLTRDLFDRDNTATSSTDIGELIQCLDLLLEAASKLKQKSWVVKKFDSFVRETVKYACEENPVNLQCVQRIMKKAKQLGLDKGTLSQILVDQVWAKSTTLVLEVFLEAGADVNYNSEYNEYRTSCYHYPTDLPDPSKSALYAAASNNAAAIPLLASHGAWITTQQELMDPRSRSVLLTRAIICSNEAAAVQLLLANCKPVIPADACCLNAIVRRNMVHFLNMFIAAAGDISMVNTLFHHLLQRESVNSAMALCDKELLRAAVAKAMNLMQICRATIRNVLRQHKRPIKELVADLNVPKLLCTFLHIGRRMESISGIDLYLFVGKTLRTHISVSYLLHHLFVNQRLFL